MRTDTPKSSNVEYFHYDPEKQELTVSFRGTGTYTYHDVPPHVHDEMKAAESHGKFINARLKGKYEFTRPTKKD